MLSAREKKKTARVEQKSSALRAHLIWGTCSEVRALKTPNQTRDIVLTPSASSLKAKTVTLRIAHMKDRCINLGLVGRKINSIFCHDQFFVMSQFECSDNTRSARFALSLITEYSQQNISRILTLLDLLSLVSWSPFWDVPSKESFSLVCDLLCFSRFAVLNLVISFAKSVGIWPDVLLILVELGSIVLLSDLLESQRLYNLSILFISLEFVSVFWGGERRRQRRLWVHNATFRISELRRNPFNRSSRRSLLLPLLEERRDPRFAEEAPHGEISPVRSHTEILKISEWISSCFVDVIPEAPGQEIEGTKMHVHCIFHITSSTNTTLVFLHQFGGGAFTWHALLSKFSEEDSFNLVAFDRIAHGLTFFSQSLTPAYQSAIIRDDFDSTMVDKVLDSLFKGPASTNVVFVACGGAGARVALDYIQLSGKHKVKGIVLISPYGLAKSDGFPSLLKSVATAQVGRALAVSMARSEVSEVIPRRSWDNRRVPDAVLQAYRESVETPGWEDSMLSLLQRPIKGTVPDPGCRVLILCGDNDHLQESPSEYLDLREKFLSETSFIVLNQCGASPQEEQPITVCEQIRAFVDIL